MDNNIEEHDLKFENIYDYTKKDDELNKNLINNSNVKKLFCCYYLYEYLISCFTSCYTKIIYIINNIKNF